MGSSVRVGRARIEVVARLGSSVLDVRHLRAARRRRGRAWSAVGVGLIGAGVAAAAWSALGLLVCVGGLALLMTMVVRSGDRDPAAYSIGEGHSVSLCTPPVDLVEPQGFELVRVGNDGTAWVRFAPQMVGEIMLGGHRGTLAQLVAAGRVVPDDGALGTTLPIGGWCRIQHGELTFEISVVEASQARIARAPLDAPMWLSSAASLAVLGSLLVLAQWVAPTAEEMALADEAEESRFVRYFASPPTPRERAEKKANAKPRPSATPLSPRVAAPQKRPSRAQRPKPVAAERPVLDDPSAQADALAVEDAEPGGTRRPRTIHGRKGVAAAAGLIQRGTSKLDSARSAGMLAMVDTSPLGESEYASAFSPDADDREMWASISKGDIAEKGIAGGLGLVGKGRGGGEGSTEGIVRAGAKESRSASVVLGSVEVRGGLDRNSARKAVRRRLNGVRRCYERSSWEATKLTLKLDIGSDGTVTAVKVSRSGKGTIPKECVTSAARRWQFRKAPRASTLTVTMTARG